MWKYEYYHENKLLSHLRSGRKGEVNVDTARAWGILLRFCLVCF